LKRFELDDFGLCKKFNEIKNFIKMRSCELFAKYECIRPQLLFDVEAQTVVEAAKTLINETKI